MSGARKPKALNASQLAALEVLVEFSDNWRRQGRTEEQREVYAALYWHTLQPSYCWPGCGWRFSPATLRSLVGRGLAEFKPGFEGAYWTRVTTLGRLALAAAVRSSPASDGAQSKSASGQASEVSDEVNGSGTMIEKSGAT
jgi:hypothetical protein